MNKHIKSPFKKSFGKDLSDVQRLNNTFIDRKGKGEGTLTKIKHPKGRV